MMPVDKQNMKQTENQNVKHIPRRDRERSKTPGGKTAGYRIPKQQTKMQILVTEWKDITPQLGNAWLKMFKLTIGNIRLNEEHQSET